MGVDGLESHQRGYADGYYSHIRNG